MKEGTLVRRRSGKRKDLGRVRYVFKIQDRVRGCVWRALVFFEYAYGHPTYGPYEQNIDLDDLVEVKHFKWVVKR